ncbi:host specificity factor TipJ family phage tail protein [Salinicola sp. CPA57]|uniref:host specificity factor TipJ family phage tail protein n=1 Tax=Salinicola sp. CPA57 TaxID=1949080 RepID=UPI00130026DD|nr:host specificity factor TipJ family phage tail protein [Salinicola sp. CPA57]
MILVYPSTMPGEPMERHSVTGCTLHDWFSRNIPNYQLDMPHLMSVKVRGRIVPPAKWQALWLDDHITVEIRPQPGDPATLAYVAVAVVVAVAATVLLAPKIPSMNNKSSRQGRSLYEVNAQGNQAKMGDLMPELAGRHRMFPDYLNAPRRYFADTTTQVLDMLLCIGVGQFEIDLDEIRIGETPVGSLGSGIDYRIFEPGEDVTSHPAYRCWYNAPEVGASSGSSGLRLRSTDNATFDGNLATDGDRLEFTIPESWETDMWLAVRLYRTITVIDGGTETVQTEVVTSATVTNGESQTVVTGVTVTRDPETGEITAVDQQTGNVYSGAVSDIQTKTITQTTALPDRVAGDWTGLAAGDRVRIWSEDLSGTFIVADITGNQMTLNTLSGDPVTNLEPGQHLAAVDVQNARYRIVEIGSSREYVALHRLNSDDEIDGAWSAFPAFSGNGNVRVVSNSPGQWTGPFQACPDKEKTSRLEFDIFAANGLGRLNDDGDIRHVDRQVELQYREKGSGEWQSVIETIGAHTRDQQGWTFAVDLPYAMTPEVQMRRLEAEDTDTKALDKIDWYGLRCEIPHKTRYEDVTVLALSIRGSNTLASQTENQVSLVPIRKLPVRVNGEWTEPQPTRDIAPWVAYVARDAGWLDSDVNFKELDRLDATWRPRGDTFDFVTDDDSTVKESINRALTAGFAELTIDRGQIRPVRDEPRGELPQHGYSAQNWLPDSFSRTITLPQPDDSDGIDVEYVDEESWTSEVVPCRLPGDQGFKVEKRKVEGVLDRTRAWRIGMRERRIQKYRREAYQFETELDALNSTYMSHASLTDDVPGYGCSGWIRGATGPAGAVTLQLSEDVEFEPGKQHVIAWRRPDGTQAGPFPVQSSGSGVVVADANELPDLDPMLEASHYQFGTMQRWSYDALVQDVQPNGFESVSVDAVNNDPRVFLDDDNSPE